MGRQQGHTHAGRTSQKNSRKQTTTSIDRGKCNSHNRRMRVAEIEKVKAPKMSPYFPKSTLTEGKFAAENASFFSSIVSSSARKKYIEYGP